MIKCHLSRMMGDKKLKVVDVARETGIHRGMVTRLYDETAVRVDLETMNALCRFFDCQVGELFEYIPVEDEK